MKKSEDFKQVIYDILSLVYQSTLMVASSAETVEAETMNEYNKTSKLVAKYNIGNVLRGMYFALYTMSMEEVVTAQGVRTRSIPVQVGDETYVLHPFIKGVERFLYETWGEQIDTVKMQVVNVMVPQGVDTQWASDFLNFPYDPDQEYVIDVSQVGEVDLGEAPKIDTSEMPEAEG